MKVLIKWKRDRLILPIAFWHGLRQDNGMNMNCFAFGNVMSKTDFL